MTLLFRPVHSVEEGVGSEASRPLPELVIGISIFDVIAVPDPFAARQEAEPHLGEATEVCQPIAKPFD